MPHRRRVHERRSHGTMCSTSALQRVMTALWEEVGRTSSVECHASSHLSYDHGRSVDVVEYKTSAHSTRPTLRRFVIALITMCIDAQVKATHARHYTTHHNVR